MAQRSRNFCITDFQNLDEESCKARYSGYRYICGAVEECPETGRKHWQGCVVYENQRTIRSLGKGTRNNVEPMTDKSFVNAFGYTAKGTREKPAEGWKAYLKDPCEGWWDDGTEPKQGDRTDLADVARLLVEGKTLREVAGEDPTAIIKFPRGLEKLRTLCIKPRDPVMPEVRVFYGPTGTGKSHAAHAWLPNAYVWGPANGHWWPDYDGETEVIFEEFRGQLQFGQLLHLLDKWPAKVELKGGFCEFRAVKIAFTSPLPPEAWYPNKASDTDSMNQLLRRVTETIHMTTPYVPEV